MAQTLQFEKSYQNVLIPAEPGTSEYLQLIPVGQLLCGEFRKPRNYGKRRLSTVWQILIFLRG
ncbi:hypothetical protein D4M53_26475 [Klebsiella pneumoniae]|nr:hypothetical protein D4M53_26475 [Klebsiella pneumoniae]